MPTDFLSLVAIGFFAQLVDGSLGMAFGLISTTAMLSLGIPPAAIDPMLRRCFKAILRFAETGATTSRWRIERHEAAQERDRIVVSALNPSLTPF